MTIEELADLTAEKLEALSADELDKILSPYYKVTRPEFAQVITSTTSKQQTILNMTPAKQKALAMLQEEGVDLSYLMKKKSK